MDSHAGDITLTKYVEAQWPSETDQAPYVQTYPLLVTLSPCSHGLFLSFRFQNLIPEVLPDEEYGPEHLLGHYNSSPAMLDSSLAIKLGLHFGNLGAEILSIRGSALDAMIEGIDA